MPIATPHSLQHRQFLGEFQGSAWTNMPAADTELTLSGTTSGVRFQTIFLLRFARHFRMAVAVSTAGFGGADLRSQVFTSSGIILNLDGGSGPEVAIDSTGQKDTGWQPLRAEARDEGDPIDETTRRIAGKDGNGVVDPVFGLSFIFR